ncbi:unnamed protein product [Schistosoma curassoni]|uniref:Ovule protein n=1 Tax=Schistosoma curassoni TaxID=6186 RepID=A0A183K186_9TREM|nr:unnamed protein product [Schistosoma curassoni]
MYLHLRVDVHSGTRTQYRSLQTPSRYPLTSVYVCTSYPIHHVCNLFLSGYKY